MIRQLALAYTASAAALLCAGTVGAQAPAKPDATKGQGIASQTCAACHANDGNSPLAANPKLAGQFFDYLHKQLVNFKPQANKKAERENPVMAGMVANLSADDLKNVAAFYASQKLKPAAARDKNLAALGQKIYRGGISATGVAACAGCHGPTGAGMPAQYPRLAGQPAELSLGWLKAYAAGSRPNAVMGPIAARMNENDMKAVSEYIAGLR